MNVCVCVCVCVCEERKKDVTADTKCITLAAV